ncbi:hypothetical protein HPB51_002174 [Rhipicephalus microplus]|uniref:Anoctamin n=1 Tax=Rhipicephalus microplus TaxID=6941 RepID=A0A9J6EL29_RHIMP|nr:hypothetical protein HPB51_002174 [Rhipicephalus microplus]
MKTGPEELFSLTERQEIVQNVIDGIRAEQLTEVVGLGHRCVLIHPGQSVFAVCCRADIVVALFAPHDYELLGAIRRQWLSNLTIPVHMIKVYFGIRIAFYYAFLSFYTWSLMVPMTVGVLVFKHRDSLQWRIAGVLFNLLWNTVILEVWRKRADYLSCFWGLHEQATPSRNRLLFTYGENMLAQRAFRILISQDIQLLRKQVYIQLLMSFTKENLVEIVMPSALHRLTSLVRHMIRREPSYLPGVHSILSEADMTKYTSTYVDYYKMFSQFAFVFLFGPVVPLAPLVAFFGNMLEMLIVGYKLTVVFQRPLKIGHEGIGIWEPAFRAIGFLAVPTNIALICVENPDSLSALSRLFTDTEFVLFLVGIEHALLLLKLTLQYALRSEIHCPHYSPTVTT